MKITDEQLAAIEKHFHALLLDIALEFGKANFRPELPVLTGEESKATERIPFVGISGMFGGCSSWWIIENDAPAYLRVVASSRMDENFERIWHVDENGYSKIIKPK